MFLLAQLSFLALASVASAQVPQLPPIPTDLSSPVQQRIAFDGPTGMTIAWNTFKQLERPTVHFGLTKFLERTAASGSSVTYPTSRTWANTVKLSGLLPGVTYCEFSPVRSGLCLNASSSDYKIASTNSTTQSFNTARIAGDPRPYTAALVVDMGVFGPDGLSQRNRSYTNQTITYPLRPDEHTTIDRLSLDASSYEFVLHPGDFAYAGTLITLPSSPFIAHFVV